MSTPRRQRQPPMNWPVLTRSELTRHVAHRFTDKNVRGSWSPRCQDLAQGNLNPVQCGEICDWWPSGSPIGSCYAYMLWLRAPVERGRVSGCVGGVGPPGSPWRDGPLWFMRLQRQHESEIIAQGRDGFQGHLAGPLHSRLVVLLEQDRSDDASAGSLAGQEADHLGAPLDLTGNALDRIGRVELGPVLLGGSSYRPALPLGSVQQRRELGQLGPELV
jgi:hypothetical protein